MEKLTSDPSKVGFDVGVGFAIFYTALCIGSGVIGIVLNYISAKICLVVFEFGLGISLIVFGFGVSKAWCFVLIGFVGAFTGISICVKVLTKEICDDDNEQRIVSWVYGGPVIIGVALGPSLAGVLALPAVQYPEMFDTSSIWGKFPILMVNLFFGILATSLSLVTYFALPGNIPEYIKAGRAKHWQKISSRKGYWQMTDSDVAELEIQRPNVSLSKAKFYECFRNDFLSNPSALASIALYTLSLGMIDAYQVLIALWLETDENLGGRDYSANDVSLVMAVSGCVLIFLNYTLLYRLHNWLSSKSLFSVTILISIPTLCFLPLTSIIVNNTTFFITCSLLHSIMVVFFAIWISVIQIFIQNSVSSSSLPFIFAIANLIGYLGSALLTPLVSSVFAKTLTTINENYQFPMDYRFAFYVTALLILFSHTPLSFVRVEDNKIITEETNV